MWTYSVAIGDLNGDRKPDLAAANAHEYPSVSVLLNRGRGGFRRRVDYEAGGGGDPYYGPTSVVIGDLNGDGKLDLVTANRGANTISVLVNRGSGTFRPKRNYIAEGVSAVAIGDLNGDRKLDVATANSGAATVSVLLNRGDGGLERKRDYPTANDPRSIAIGDLDGDGNRDLATANFRASNVSVLLGNRDGTFQAKRSYPTGRHPSSVAIGDLNGDGKPELATANTDANSVSVLRNSGGRFEARANYPTGRLPQSIAIGDLNRDGKRELVTANNNYPTNSVSVLTNRGDGTFRRKHDYLAGSALSSVAIGDLNGDGKPDLAVAITGDRPQFDSRAGVLTNATGLCGVPDVRFQTVPVARRMITNGACRVGDIHYSYSTQGLRRGLVMSQKPTPGKVLRKGGKVDFVVSRGRK